MRLGPPAPQPINAQTPAPRRGKIQEYEAVKRRKLAAVKDRVKSFWKMCVEVTNRHRAREDKRDRAGEQTDYKKRTADQFNQARGAAH